MTDNELLLAISNMLEPITINVQDLRNDMSDVKKHISNMENRLTNVENHVSNIENRLTNVENHVLDIEFHISTIDINLKTVKITQENDVIPRVQNIESCYISTYDRYKNSVTDYESMKQDISILKKVVTDHSEKIQLIS